MIKRIAIILFVLAYASFAATYYVDPDNGDNANGGTSAEDAWETIQYAIDNVDGVGPHTIYCADGDYNYTDQGTLNGIQPEQATNEGQHITFIGAEGGITFEGGNYAFWIDDDDWHDANYTYYEFRNFNFQWASLTLPAFFMQPLNNWGLKLVNCSIENTGSGSGAYFAFSGVSNDVNRVDIALTDCNFTEGTHDLMGTGAGDDINTVNICGCNIEIGNGSLVTDTATSEIGDVNIADNNIIGGTASMIGWTGIDTWNNFSFVDNTTSGFHHLLGLYTGINNLTVTGNNTTDVNAKFIVIGSASILDVNIYNATIANNTIAGPSGNNTTWFCDAVYLNDNNEVALYGNTGTNLQNGVNWKAGDKVYIQGNLFTINQDSGVAAGINIGSNDTPDETTSVIGDLYNNVYIADCRVVFTGADNAHGILIGGDIVGATVLNNYIEGGNYQLVCKGKAAHIVGNILVGAQALYLSGGQGCFVMNNTIYASATYALSFSNNGGFGTSRTPTGNVYINNIFSAAADVNAFDGYAKISLEGQIFNYNCWYSSGSNPLAFNGSTYATIAAMQAAEDWENWAGIDNSDNGITSNPQFFDAANGDCRLKPTSSCINTGQPTTGGDSSSYDGYSDMGAWQRRSLLRIP